MEPSTFDVVPKRNHISGFKIDKPWMPKYFFEDMVLFKALLNYYNNVLHRFELKTLGERNKAHKILERNGFDYDLVEDRKGIRGQAPQIREVCVDLTAFPSILFMADYGYPFLSWRINLIYLLTFKNSSNIFNFAQQELYLWQMKCISKCHVVTQARHADFR
jgi:hypothetical protein